MTEMHRGVNPIIHADFPDPDVIRHGDMYYMISTSMHMFPGGQILRSGDLLHWEHCSYVFDTLGETASQRMDGGCIYGRGMWAASLREHGGVFHVVFTSNDTRHSYHYTAASPEGPWTRQPMEGFWYDPGLLFDGDGRVFVAHGNRTIRLTELTADLSRRAGEDRIILQDSDDIMLGWEGSHLFRHDGWYYLFNIHWRRGGMRAMGCHRARSLEGPFTGGEFMELDLHHRHAGVAQGGPVQLHDGSFALLLFQDHGAVGRIPVVVPFRWVDGWPVVDEAPETLSLPCARPGWTAAPLFASDPLRGSLSPLWQWNHEPHPELVHPSAEGLCITADRLAENCTRAVNTLTQRCFGPVYEACVTVHADQLRPGDHAGLCALMGCFAQLSVVRGAEGLSLVHQRRDAATEQVVSCDPLALPPGTQQVQLEAHFDFTADTVSFRARVPGGAWIAAGPVHQLVYRLDHFMGCRAGLFIHATRETGGTARFTDFTCKVMEG